MKYRLLPVSFPALGLLACAAFSMTSCTKQSAPGADPPRESVAATSPTPAVKPSPSPRSFDGPFGLKSGLPVEAVKQLTELAPTDTRDVYTTEMLPKPHAAFESYVLGFSQTAGLCAVTAIGKNIESGQTGAEIRSAFDSLEEGLSSKYGKGKNYDFATGLMDEMQYWMIALSDKNRTLATFWSKESGSSLPGDISSIALQAHALDMSTGFVNLRYEFSNIEQCLSESKAQENSAL